MFGFRLFLCGLFVGAGGGLFVANYHVIHTADGLVVVARAQQPPLRSSYVDIRSWSPAMWTNHPEVTEALVASGRTSLIRDQLKDDLLDEILPQQTENQRRPASRNVARRIETPIQIETDEMGIVTSQKAPARRAFESTSPMRKRFESAVDQAIAPLVEDDPADLASHDPNAVIPSDPDDYTTDHDAMVQRLEDRLGGLLDKPLTQPNVRPSQFEVTPTAGDTREMARDLLQQVIPQGSTQPQGGATPFRDILNAPAPGQNGANLSQPRPKAQSQLMKTQPF